MKIQYTDQIPKSNGQKVLLYGRSKMGKTTSLASAPRPFVLSAEAGLLSLRGMKVPYADITSYKGLVDAYTWAMESPEAKNYDTFCLDSLSEIAEVILAQEKKKTTDARKSYPAMKDQVTGIVRDFRNIKEKHVVFIAKEMEEERVDDNNLAYTYTSPNLPSKSLSTDAAYYFDHVFHMFQYQTPKELKHMFRTQQTTRVLAGTRSIELDSIVDPDFTEIFKLCS